MEVQRGNANCLSSSASWLKLQAAKQEEMDDVIAMLEECSTREHVDAQMILADVYALGQGVPPNEPRAFQQWLKAAHNLRTPGWRGERGEWA